MRILEIFSGGTLIGLAFLKLAPVIGIDLPGGGNFFESLSGGWLALVVLVAVVELGLGVSFIAGKTRAVSACGLLALGAAFCLWTMIMGPEGISAKPCGCFGPYRLEYMSHLLASGGLLSLGGIHTALLPRSSRNVT